jgi:hypothetical protein
VVEGRCMDRGGGVRAVDANENGYGRSAASAVVVARRRTAIGASRAGGMGNAARRLTRRLECASRAGQDHAAVLTISGDEFALVGVFVGSALEAPTVVAGLDDVAVVGQAIDNYRAGASRNGARCGRCPERP